MYRRQSMQFNGGNEIKAALGGAGQCLTLSFSLAHQSERKETRDK